MQGFPPPADQRWTHEGWSQAPQNRWAFQHIREVLPTARVARAPRPRPLPTATRQLDPGRELARADGSTAPIGTLLSESFTDGFIVLQDGEIRLETYPSGMPADRTHLLQSVSKSLVGCVAGILVERGRLDVDEQLTTYVPEVSSSGYAGATVRDVLDMRSGIAFDEDYLNPAADVRIYEKAIGWAPDDGSAPSSLYDYISTLRSDREHGGGFVYRSIETDMLGWACERAAGARMPDLLSELLWIPLGAEQDMDATVDSAGAVLHDGGLAVTLRDLARFGQLIADQGRVDDRQVVPSGWFDDAAAGAPDSRAAFAAAGEDDWMPGGHYRNQLWIPFPDHDVIMCLGIHGQMVYVDRPRRFVAAKLSSTPEPTPEQEYFDTVALIQQLADLCS